jgi:hypothetical protein
VPENADEQVVEVVRQAPGEHAQRIRAPAGLELPRELAALDLVPPVLNLRHVTEWLAVGRAHEADGQEHRDGCAVLAEVPLLHLIRVDLPGDHLPDEVQVVVQVGGVRDLLERDREQLLLAVADQLAKRAIDPQERAVETHDRLADRRIVERGLEFLLRVQQLALDRAIAVLFHLPVVGAPRHPSDRPSGPSAAPPDPLRVAEERAAIACPWGCPNR